MMTSSSKRWAQENSYTLNHLPGFRLINGSPASSQYEDVGNGKLASSVVLACTLVKVYFSASMIIMQTKLVQTKVLVGLTEVPTEFPFWASHPIHPWLPWLCPHTFKTARLGMSSSLSFFLSILSFFFFRPSIFTTTSSDFASVDI